MSIDSFIFLECSFGLQGHMYIRYIIDSNQQQLVLTKDAYDYPNDDLYEFGIYFSFIEESWYKCINEYEQQNMSQRQSNAIYTFVFLISEV